MSTGEDIHTTYYSAILAKALKQDDQKFEKLYALICEDSSKEKVFYFCFDLMFFLLQISMLQKRRELFTCYKVF